MFQGERSRRAPRGLFWTSVQSVALEKEQWQTWGPLIRHLVSTRLPSGGRAAFLSPLSPLDGTSLSRKLAYVPGPTFGFVKLLASSGSHCTKWADEQHRQAGFESRLLPDLPLPFIPTLIGLRAFDLVSSRVWWEAATNTWQCMFQMYHRPIPYHYLFMLLKNIVWISVVIPKRKYKKVEAILKNTFNKWVD